jgi:site-specific recombinase
METDMDTMQEMVAELRSLRLTVQELVAVLTPREDEPSPERDLITVMADLTGAVDDAAAVVSAMHSTVSTLARSASVPA